MVSDKTRFVVGTFDLILVKSELPSMTLYGGVLIGEKEKGNLKSVRFSAEQKNFVEIRERDGVAVEMRCPATPVGYTFTV